MARPLPSAISVQCLERIVDSDESLTSDMELSKPSSDIDAAATGSSQASSDIACTLSSSTKIAPASNQVESARVVKRGKLDNALSCNPDTESAFQIRSASCRATTTTTTQSIFFKPKSFDSIKIGFDNRKGSVRTSKKILVKVPTIANLNLKSNNNEVSRCAIRKHHSLNVRINDNVEKKSLDFSRSRNSFTTGARAPKIDDFNLIGCHENPIVLSSEDDDEESLSSPPPLSNLHIFAISTKPEDIQLVPMEDPIPGEIDKLPSLPIIDHHGNKKKDEIVKLSILEPPPPELVVSREESNENWNRFLNNLNLILESRAGEFV